MAMPIVSTDQLVQHEREEIARALWAAAQAMNQLADEAETANQTAKFAWQAVALERAAWQTLARSGKPVDVNFFKTKN